MTWHRRNLQLALLALMVLVAAPQHAAAQARLLVLAPAEQSERPTLLEALRLHLRGTARVEPSARPFPAGTAASRVALATSIVAEERAQFAIWLESVPLGDGTLLFALYVVGGRQGRAVVEVVRLPAESDGPDVDRTLALKASEIVEAALTQPAMLQPVRASAPTAVPAPRAKREAPPLRWALEVSGALRGVSSASDSEVGLGLGASVLSVSKPLELDVRLSAVLLSDSVVTGQRRRVRVSETDAALGIGLRSTGQVQLGARLDLCARLVDAEGFASSERTGSALVVVPGVAAGPELRLRLGRRMSFSAHVAAEWMAVRQSFVVDGVSAVDLGRLRGNAQLSLVFFVL
jgi:hypothetical protein